MNFPFICSNIPAAPAYGVHISQLIRYSRACGSNQDFFDRGLLLTKEATEPRVPLCQVEVITSKVLWSPPWLGWQLRNICVTNDHGYVPLVVNTSWFSPHSWLMTRFVTRLTWRVPLVEQERLTILEHLSSCPIFRGVRVTWSLVLYVCFVNRCLSFYIFSFGHCLVCSSSIYRFWLPLWYLLAIVLSVLRFTDYLFGISKLFLWE